MAKVLSGSFNTTAYGDRHLVFSWTATQNVAKNQSTINWSLKAAGSSTNKYYSGNFKVVIAGETVYSSSARIQLPNGYEVASGTKVLTHNTNGAKSFSASAQAGIYYYAVNVSGSGEWDLQDIPRFATITKAPNFTDEENPTITYSNPAGSKVTTLQAGIFLDSNNSAASYRDISKTGTSYTFNLTDAEREVLRKNTVDSNTRTVRFYIKTVTADGASKLNYVSKTLTIVNANPTVSVTLTDSDADMPAITGDSKCFVRYYSNLNFEVTGTARKRATIESYNLVNGDTTRTSSSGTIGNIKNNVIKASVTDSRGKTATKTIDLANNTLGYSYVPYVKPTCSIKPTVKLVDSTNAQVEIEVSGDYYNGNIGSTANALTLKYYIKNKATGSITESGTVVESKITFTGNKYKATIKSYPWLDYQATYEVYCEVRDKLPASTAKSDTHTLTLKPVFDWGKNDFNFNVPVTIQGTNYKGGTRMLWGGDRTTGYCMDETQEIELSEAVGEQTNGILLAFCYYNGDDDTNRLFQYHFVPKEVVAAIGATTGNTHCFVLGSSLFGAVGAKTLYIGNKKIYGTANNKSTGTANTGITYNNSKFVLRYVIGV